MLSEKLYLFQENENSYQNFPSPYVIRGYIKTVTQFVSKKDLANQIGGYVIWAPPTTSDPRMPGDAIGVFGKREISRFKRLLKESGAEYILIKERGPIQKVNSISRYYVPLE